MPKLTITTDQTLDSFRFIEHELKVTSDEAVSVNSQLNYPLDYIGVIDTEGSTHSIRKMDIHKVTIE